MTFKTIQVIGVWNIIQIHLVVSHQLLALLGWYDLCTKKASRWSCWIYLAWEVAVVMPTSRWTTQLGKLKTSASWKTPCVARPFFSSGNFLSEALVLGKWMSHKWHKHIGTIIHMWPMYTNVAFRCIYYWLFDAQSSSKHCSGGLKVARTHLVASWQSQCFSQQALAMKHWISDKQQSLHVIPRPRNRRQGHLEERIRDLGLCLFFPIFRPSAKPAALFWSLRSTPTSMATPPFLRLG